MRVLRLFNEPQGKAYLKNSGLNNETVDQLDLIGISGISNILSAIKTAKYFEMDSNDAILTIATDSADMYQSRLVELTREKGEYQALNAALDFEGCILHQKTDHMKELGYKDQKAIHNLKYFTWVEQQGKTVEDLNTLWYNNKIWETMFNQTGQWDELIDDFNEKTGLIKQL
jgi:hypothetical protein